MDITDLRQKEKDLREKEKQLRKKIAQRKQTEAALRESLERLELALSGANEGVWDWNIEKNTVYFDSRYYTIAGYEPDEFPATIEEWEKRVHPDDIWKTKDRIKRILSGELCAFQVEYRFLRKDGSYMWIQGKAHIASRDDNGNPARFIGTNSDITERRGIEDSLRITRFSFEKAAIGIYRIDSDARILDVNDKAADMLGYTKEELESLTIYDIDPMVNSQIWRAVWQTLVSYEADDFETIHRRKDGTEMPVAINSNLFEYDGQPYSISFVRDITEHKQMLDTLKKRENDLDEKTRYLEKVNQALKASLDHREVEKRSVEEDFIANLKRFIVPYVEDLSRCRLSGEGAAYLNIIRMNLDDFMSRFSRTLSSKYIDFTPAEIRVADLIRNGRDTKEIARMMNLSPASIHWHRKNIRKKLGLNNKKVNLYAYLKSIPG